MDLTSVKTIKELLSKHNTKPSKTMGQNFLIDQLTLNNIIEASNIKKEDTILEIGPGIGTLTQELAKKAGKIVAIEKDTAMIGILKENLKDYKNIEIIQGDARYYNFDFKNYKVVANIPYYLTSPIIRKFLELENKPSVIVLMVQKEVAQRICQKPPKMSLLAVSVQFYAEAEIISYVSKGKFWPSPKIDSAIIKIVPHKNNPPVPIELFFKVVKAGFLHPRKQLGSNLSNALKKDKEEIHLWLLKNNIQPNQRAETLTIQDWIHLTDSYSHLKSTT